jgi:hypothetical protein
MFDRPTATRRASAEADRLQTTQTTETTHVESRARASVGFAVTTECRNVSRRTWRCATAACGIAPSTAAAAAAAAAAAFERAATTIYGERQGGLASVDT